MFDYFVLAFYMLRESIAARELGALIKRQISWNRILTPVEMDLSGSLPRGALPADSDLRFVELRPEDIQAGKWVFAVQSRGIKAHSKLKSGIRGYAFVRGQIVIGDVWCVTPPSGQSISHPEFRILGLASAEHEAFAFDMLIDPKYRGKNLAAPLQRALQHALKKEGFLKVYGSYYDDNLPALWMHRMLQFRELPKRKVTRFFFYSKSAFVDVTDHPVVLANTSQKGN